MKKQPLSETRRPYQQGARAAAAEATGERILTAFLARIEAQWFEDITLEAVARDAGVSVQTVIRRFGGKDGLLERAMGLLDRAVQRRRSTEPGGISRAIAVLTEDYEASGDLVCRLLDQEQRHPALKVATDAGRVHHRAWLAAVFADWLADADPAVNTARLDALVVATDLYVWKLLRRDMGRPVDAFTTLSETLVRAVLEKAPRQSMDAPR
ncbi:hypothetical protein GCM10009116_18010 [Brevundimonas basaltis]|uniref:AcrR family transcriptional regulator n=1 Tax=Brevundimonas basaltis TaxID=472166 RepID=A0A7W8HVY2_9CAUL|nr:TetR/AcrR family transcriptional regulator [Brevundimonas basaltis]MBB5290891.1 AcrR family transcriptional regulator [Brevundimonas basaltis]